MKPKATKPSMESAVDSKAKRQRKKLAFLLNILFWIVFLGTLLLDFQEKEDIAPTNVLSSTPQELDSTITDEP